MRCCTRGCTLLLVIQTTLHTAMWWHINCNFVGVKCCPNAVLYVCSDACEKGNISCSNQATCNCQVLHVPHKPSRRRWASWQWRLCPRVPGDQGIARITFIFALFYNARELFYREWSSSSSTTIEIYTNGRAIVCILCVLCGYNGLGAERNPVLPKCPRNEDAVRCPEHVWCNNILSSDHQ